MDFGANDGSTVAAYLAAAKVDLCYAFEPNPTLAAALRLRFDGQGVEVVEKAAWDRDGTMPLYLGHSQSSTLLTGKVPLDNYPEYVITYDASVDVVTLDTAKWLRETIRPGDEVVMKMDIEGSEYVVLPKLIEGGEIDMIAELRCEFHPERFPAYQGLHGDLVKDLASRTRLVEWH
nr:FkbM family methyltransferase [Pelagibacterium xiamenense]